MAIAEIVSVHGMAVFGGKHKIKVLVSDPCPKPLRSLPAPVKLKRLNQCRAELNPSAALYGLGLVEAPPFLAPSKAPINLQRPPV